MSLYRFDQRPTVFQVTNVLLLGAARFAVPIMLTAAVCDAVPSVYFVFFLSPPSPDGGDVRGKLRTD